MNSWVVGAVGYLKKGRLLMQRVGQGPGKVSHRKTKVGVCVELSLRWRT